MLQRRIRAAAATAAARRDPPARARDRRRRRAFTRTSSPSASPSRPRKGYRLDRGAGADVVAHALTLGLPIIAVHKGIPLAGIEPGHSSPIDIGPAAKMFPAATFLVYHAGIELDQTQGPYDPTATRGVDALIRSCLEAGIGKDGNVYAELGSAWRSVMHWYGSPQDPTARDRAAYLENPSPSFRTHGPRTRRELFALLKHHPH